MHHRPSGTNNPGQRCDLSGNLKNLVVGAGISGAVVARKIAEEWTEPVTVVEARDHIGGNLHDCRRDEVMVQRYGPHIFHTNNEEVWKFLGHFTEWWPYQHRVLGFVDGQQIPIPFNLNSLRMVFPKTLADRLEIKLLKKFGFGTNVSLPDLPRNDEDLNFLAEYVFQKVFLGYTRKQWGLPPAAIDPAVFARVPAVRISRDDRYFLDRYQGIPLHGYTAMVQKLLAHKNIHVHLNTPFARDMPYDRLFWTGSPDEFFENKLGSLPYRSVAFDFLTLARDKFQKVATVNYPNDHDFTRITEYKHFLDDRSDGTIISCEYPADWCAGVNDRQYPIENRKNAALHASYKAMAKGFSNVYFLGRLGDYKYYNMDEAIARAMAMVKELANSLKENV
ncbi:MAG: UDP-galactopyranose mutase [Puniceicoccales bacterium]|jgi:UDP-galactopyranose mutase|nr:UDP-galactopyranose mutase [Puniceicoccales bacterium]